MAVAAAAAATLQMWHATKVAGSSGAQKPLHRSDHKPLPAPSSSSLVRGPKSNRCTRGKHRQALSSRRQEQSPYQLAIRLPELQLQLPNAASCCHSHNNFTSRCRFLSENVVQSAALMLSSSSSSLSSSSLFCKLSPAIRTERTALLALTLNCQRHVTDHAIRGALQQFAGSFSSGIQTIPWHFL